MTRTQQRWKAIAVAVVLLAAAGGAAAGWSSRPAVAYQTETVARTDIESTVTAIGTLQPRRYVDVGAQVSGQVTRLRVEPGAQVEKGALLVEIDPSVQRATVDAGRASLAGLRAQLAEQQALRKLAEQQLTRQRQLARDGATREEDLQTAEANLAAAGARMEHLKAQIDQTQATLKADEARLGYTRIYAPMAGTVVSVEAREGRFVRAARAGWFVESQLSPIGQFETDPVAVAERFLGAPYQWGGRESLGLDCSGLVQQAFYACGLTCPRDTDMQAAQIGTAIDGPELRRGDLVFWKGHVGLMQDDTRLLHANAHHMAVASEPLDGAILRIEAAGSGKPTAFRRP